ncbi:hypothetical protein PIROE2DRAFT_6971 [Piromyces sp. E2]|nr:hypothetical protein PIROE2DRAFT_6971 [Piromyces sp. E2]|eukprot:OUM65903.1 hypothetical protein PIROE2DRAFT_6971 [Piromyces sp. E2]
MEIKDLFQTKIFYKSIEKFILFNYNFENNDTSKQTANTELDYAQLKLQHEQQQQHEIQQQQHQQQLYQILQNQQIPNRKHVHQRNKSFSSFLSIKYKNQPQSINNSFFEKNSDNKNKNNAMDNNKKECFSKRSSSVVNPNDCSVQISSDYIKDVFEKKEDSFSSKKLKKRNHTKSYSENTQKNERYNYDSVSCNNNNFEGSFYNKISTAIKNRKLTNSKKASKDSYKSYSKKSNTESSAKKKNNKKSITNFDILKKQLENLGNKKKTEDSHERSRKSFLGSKDNNNDTNNKSDINTDNDNNVALSDNQAIKNDNNKNYYNTLNESINNSIEINNNGNEFINNDSNSVINSKKELYTVKHDSKSLYNDQIAFNNVDDTSELSEIIEDCEKKDDMRNDKKDSKENDENLIIVKPFCQINTSNEVLSSQSSSCLNIANSSHILCSDENIHGSSEESLKKLNDGNKSHLRNKVLKYKNKNDQNEKTNVISLFNDGMTVSPSVSNSNLEGNEIINTSNFSSNEKVISSNESLAKSRGSEKDTKTVLLNTNLDNPSSKGKNKTNNQLLDVPCSPSLSVASQSSASSQSSDLTCSSISYSEDEEDEDDEQFFFSVNELTGTINGDLIKLNEENKNGSVKVDSNSVNSSEPKKSSFVSLNNDIIIKTIEEKLKEKIIDKQQNFKYLDFLNGSKLSYSKQNHTKHKRNALSYQYTKLNIKNDVSEQNKYYSLNSLHKKSHSLSQSFIGGSMSKNNSYVIDTINKQKISHKSITNSQQMGNSKEFQSFVDIYYQYDDKIIKVSHNNIGNFGNSSKVNKKEKYLSVPKQSDDGKVHCTLDANGVIINQNDDVKAKSPDFRVYCSNEFGSSIMNSHNNNVILSSFQEVASLDNIQRIKDTSIASDSFLEYRNIETGVLSSTYSQSTTTTSSNEINKPVIILSSERINESNSSREGKKSSYVKYYLTPDGSMSSVKDGNVLPSSSNNNENVPISDNDIEKSNNNNNNNCNDSNNVNNNDNKNNSNNKNNNNMTVNIKTETDNQCICDCNNNNNNNNINNVKNDENTREEDDKLSPLSSSSNNDLIEQMQVFWRVTFPKNEGYHLVLRKGGIGNLSNKVINKYRKKLWEKRNKEKEKMKKK